MNNIEIPTDLQNIEMATFIYAFAIAIVILTIGLIIVNKIYNRKKKTKKTINDISDSDNLNISNPYPYLIRIKNTCTENKTAILFGYNKYFCKNNFGSDKEIIITSSCTNLDYCEILAESAFYPFSINTIRLMSDNIEQLKQIIKLNSKSAKGEETERPLFMNEQYYELKRNGAVQELINEIKFPNQRITKINISSKDSLIFNILPETELTVVIFPNEKLRTTNYEPRTKNYKP